MTPPKDITSKAAYFCGDCGISLYDRDAKQRHNDGHIHKTRIVQQKMEALGYVRTRTIRAVFDAAGVPWVEDFDIDATPRTPEAKALYVPAQVQRHVEEWLTFPRQTKLALPLTKYLEAVFKEVYTKPEGDTAPILRDLTDD